MRRIGVLLPAAADDAEYQARVGAFLQGLALLGWTIGHNVRIDTRWATADAANIRRHAAELAALAPDVILAHANAAIGASQQASRTIPIVFPVAGDPVASGFVNSLARPGGNTTGFAQFEYSLSGKWLEMLKQIAPGVTRTAVLRDTDLGSGTTQFAVIQALAPSIRVEVTPISMRDASEIEQSVDDLLPLSERRSDRDGGRGGAASSRTNRRAGGPAQVAFGLLRSILRRGRRPDLIWGQHDRPVPTCGRLCRSHPQG